MIINRQGDVTAGCARSPRADLDLHDAQVERDAPLANEVVTECVDLPMRTHQNPDRAAQEDISECVDATMLINRKRSLNEVRWTANGSRV
jgi:hypothetical protein